MSKRSFEPYLEIRNCLVLIAVSTYPFLVLLNNCSILASLAFLQYLHIRYRCLVEREYPAAITNYATIHYLVSWTSLYPMQRTFHHPYSIMNPTFSENYSILVSECSMDGSWTPPHLNCYFDPVAAANNLKKVIRKRQCIMNHRTKVGLV